MIQRINGIKGVTFAASSETIESGVHSSIFNMVLSKVTIGSPDVKTHYVDVPGMDGSVDLTSYFNDTVRYQNRVLQFEFTFLRRADSELYLDYTNLMSYLHGKFRGYISIDGDDYISNSVHHYYYYSGRVFVGDLQKGKLSKVVLKCDCEPYKTELPSGEKYL